ncbi:cyclic nucleotide-binding domain-containing protein [Pelagibacterium sp. 26DY04]|uniref:cyclic nucleotide-binding domain-containing protein n=1 Tax=Pelagibacterium sp. 26DY04 TaxID=2967130 RepID=UPI002815C3AE|nr:cyclic nucleotide-binding domain-containing protein [Pelagibacterium sp. 26DY04]WMT86969.1 cyclic nucleotide-binding domain-containing protein [Pelagibacterium sp. 26DY04]
MDEAAAVAAFGELDIFASFSDDQLRLLAFVAEDVSLRAGDTLYSAGEAADGAYVLVSGALEASHPETQGGGRFRIEPVALVGELGLMLTRPRAATIKAMRTSTALFVPREPFLKLLRNHPELAEDVAQTLRAELVRYLDSIAQLGGRFSG